LDEVLGGGYPEGRTTLIAGGPGAGKTLVALQFLFHGATNGTPGIFISFEENEETVYENAATLGWDLQALKDDGLFFSIHPVIDTAAVTAGPFSLNGLMAVIDGKSRDMGSRRLVIDAIDILMRRFANDFRSRDELNGLHAWLYERRLTTLLSVKTNDSYSLSEPYSFLDYMADCVMRLDHRVADQVSTRRLRVRKYRGSSFGTNEYPYVISSDGVALIPVAAAQITNMPLGPYITSGNSELDLALNGGYRRGSCILVAGSSGTGKTTLVCTFLRAACSRGESTLYISFEESPDALETAVLSAGIALQAFRQTKVLRFISRLPESAGSDEHLFLHLETIKSFQPQHVVVDAISACHRMGSGKAAFDYCMRLVNVCKERGITCLLTNQMKDSPVGKDVSGLGFSSLVDTVIQLKYEVTANELQRRLVVLKARGSKHSPRFHALHITDNGIVLDHAGLSANSMPSEESGPMLAGEG
jgi:circadian clock protein KaiC